jgi:hypothetical protein
MLAAWLWGVLLVTSFGSAWASSETLLLEVELNDERLARGALVQPLDTGCAVERQVVEGRLLQAPPGEWIRFDQAKASCGVDHRLGVARLQVSPDLLTPKTLLLLGSRGQPAPPTTPTSSAAIDILASLNGVRTGIILSHAATQLSLLTTPRGGIDQWTAEWSDAKGPQVQLGNLVAARQVGQAPSAFFGVRVSSQAGPANLSPLELGALELNRPSRIRVLNEQAQELLGMTALPAGAYRILGPTAQTRPGLLRIEIEGPDGSRQERILPWTQSPSLLHAGERRWELSTNRRGDWYGVWGMGLSPRDSLWWVGQSDARRLAVQWATRRLPAQLWQAELGVGCPSRCQLEGAASVQASLGPQALLNLGLRSELGAQASFSGSLGPQASLTLSASPNYRSLQLGWTLSPRSRLALQATAGPQGNSMSVQWSFSLDARHQISMGRRLDGPEIQYSRQPTHPQGMGWSLLANRTGHELAARQHAAWGDWGVQLRHRRAQGQAEFNGQLATRLWLTQHSWQFGPVGDYNLVEIETGESELELTDSMGQVARTDTHGVASFTRMPAHAALELRPNLRTLSFTRAPPFQTLSLRVGQKRAYRVVAKAASSVVKSYRLRDAGLLAPASLRDARGRPVYLSPDGYLDIESSHVFPLQRIAQGALQACSAGPDEADVVWVVCPSPAQ